MLEAQVEISQLAAFGSDTIGQLFLILKNDPILQCAPPPEAPDTAEARVMPKAPFKPYYLEVVRIDYEYGNNSHAEAIIAQELHPRKIFDWTLTYLGISWTDDKFGLPANDSTLGFKLDSWQIERLFQLNYLIENPSSESRLQKTMLRHYAAEIGEILVDIRDPIVQVLEENNIPIPENTAVNAKT
jgi:hypothetical protein